MAISIMSLNFYNDYSSPWSPAMTADIPAGSLRALLATYFSAQEGNPSAITWDSKSPDITKTSGAAGYFGFYLWLIGTGPAIPAKNIAVTVGGTYVKTMGLWRLSGVRQNTTAMGNPNVAQSGLPNGDAFWRDYGSSPGVLTGGLGVQTVNRVYQQSTGRVQEAANCPQVFETADTEVLSSSYRYGGEPVNVQVHDTTGDSSKYINHAEIAIHPGKQTLGIMTYCIEWVKKYNDLLRQGAIDLSKQPLVQI